MSGEVWDEITPLHRWSLEMDKSFDPTHCDECEYLPRLGLKLIYVSKNWKWKKDTHKMCFKSLKSMNTHLMATAISIATEIWGMTIVCYSNTN